jgi:hypothetical protein
MIRRAEKIGVGCVAAVAVLAAGCEDPFVQNFLTAMREASVMTTNDAINGFFETRFGLAPEEHEHEEASTAEEHGDEHGGNNLFVRL